MNKPFTFTPSDRLAGSVAPGGMGGCAIVQGAAFARSLTARTPISPPAEVAPVAINAAVVMHAGHITVSRNIPANASVI